MGFKVITGCWEKKFQDYFYIGIIALLIVGIVISASIYIARDWVVLEADGVQYQFHTFKPTVAEVLTEKGIVLNQGDVIKPGLLESVKENTRIEVTRAFPIKIVSGGKTIDFYTISRPVKDILTEANVEFDEDDKIKPDLDSIIKAGQKIRVVKVTAEVITKQVVLKPGVEYRKDNQLERGTQKELRSGVAGLAERQVKVVYEDGRVARNITVAEKIIKPVVNAIIALGTKPVVRTLVTSRGTYRYVEMKVMDATAYYPGPESCGKYAVNGVTYTGKKAGFGYVAVDPKVIKLGTKLYIEGYGYAEAADIGGAIKGNRIDLCYETYREAWMFGRKKIKVYILE